MLTESQQGHLGNAAKELADSLNKEQLRRLYFLVDDILQYGAAPAALAIHKTLDKMLHDRKS